MTTKILVAESTGFSREAADLLRSVGEVTFADLDRPGLLSAVEDTNVLMIRLRHRIDQEVLDRAPKLETLVSPTTGLNHIDVSALKRRGIRLLSLQGEVDFLKDVRATAEHTIGLMLALLRSISPAAEDVKSGHWNRDAFRGGELHRRKIGIIGYGRIGTLVKRYLHAFEADTRISDPLADENSLRLEELLEWSDLVTLHASWSSANDRFFSLNCFERMKPGSFFVNTARGELVDETALLESLKSGKLGGAALDVLADEQHLEAGNHPLVAYARSHSNLLITPHIGGCTAESMAKTEIFLAERLRQTLDHRKLEEKTNLIHV